MLESAKRERTPQAN